MTISHIADGNEVAAILSAADALISEDEERKQAVVNGLLSGTGEIGGSTCKFRALKYFVRNLLRLHADTRISDIFQQYCNPPRAPTPVQDGYVEEVEVEAEAEVEAADEEVEEEEETPAVAESTDAAIPVAIEPTATLSSSLRFIQESEIETPAFDGVWVEKADATGHEEVLNGHALEAPVTPSAPVGDV